MPPQVRCSFRNDDHVPGTDRDFLLAAGADVALHGLKRVDEPHLDRSMRVGVAGHARFLPSAAVSGVPPRS